MPLLTLPQETLNEVIAHLRGEKRALQSFSLVDRRLTEECRRYLFSSIRIDNATKLTRWSDAISPGKDGLSRYVRLLYMEGGSLCAPTFLRDHLVTLRSFTQIEHLRICPFEFNRFMHKEVVRYFGHFSTTRSVYIQPIGNYQSLLEFLTLFPLLETTVITSPRIWPWSPSASLPTVVCRGNLVIRVCKIAVPDNILSCFQRSTTCYRRLGFEFVMVLNFAPFERFFETCGSSLNPCSSLTASSVSIRFPIHGIALTPRFRRTLGPLPRNLTFHLDQPAGHHDDTPFSDRQSQCRHDLVVHYLDQNQFRRSHYLGFLLPRRPR